MSVTAIAPDIDFGKAARLVLDYLTANVPLALWSVTRVENGRQTFLYLDEDNGYAKPRGDSHAWADSFCIHMAAGTGPTVALDAQSVPVYANAGVNDIAKIGAYGGAVISEPDGQLFGAICGLDPDSHIDDATLAGAAPLLKFMGQMLTLVLAGDRERDHEAGRLLEATLASETDALTGLHNRRAWDRVVAEEEAHFQRYADPTVAVMMDLDHLKAVNDTEGHAAGDAYIQAAGAALRKAVRTSDFVARLGGDEFGVVMRQCTEENAEVVIAHIHEELARAGVSSSVGWAPITVLKGFPGAIADADAAMYAAKTARRTSDSTSSPPRP